jgi:hypothetical protein
MDTEQYLVVYCKGHNYGKLISTSEISDEFDTEGNLDTLVEHINICKSGFFKKLKPCVCELHGVIDINEAGIITLNRQYGYPHERVYPKGWKLKYYLRDIKQSHKDYKGLCDYFIHHRA